MNYQKISSIKKMMKSAFSILFKFLITSPCMLYHCLILFFYSLKYNNKKILCKNNVSDENLILLIHGNNSGIHEMVPLANHLLENDIIKNNYNVILLKVYYGNFFKYSSIDDEMNIIKKFLSSTKYKNVILIGYSKGGLTCLNTLINMPKLIKKVITINSPVQGTRTADIFLPNLTKKFIDTKNELKENSEKINQLKSIMLNYTDRVFHIVSKNEFMIYPYTNGFYDYSNYFWIENWYYSHIGFTFNKNIIQGIIQFIFYQ